VQEHEQALLSRLHDLLDQHNDVAAAAEQVRSLMFVERFRRDIDQRLEALEQ
jgi:molecular chaperone HscB